MKMRIFKILCPFLLIFVFGCSYKQNTKTEKYIPFYINENNNHIICDFLINDSVKTSLIFDLGASKTAFDSVFWNSHFEKDLNYTNMEILLPLTNLVFLNGIEYKKDLKLGFNNTNFHLSSFNVFNMGTLKNKDKSDLKEDGWFTIPVEDTLNVWEINFENSYIQVHQEIDLSDYKNKIQVDFRRKIDSLGNQQFTIFVPIKIICEKDTFYSETEYIIDTGSPYDIYFLNQGSPEVSFLEIYGQNMPIFDRSSSLFTTRKNIVKTMLFNVLEIDSLGIYNHELKMNLGEGEFSFDRIVGLNFLNRFNLYFDLKNNKLTFVPLEKHVPTTNFAKEKHAYALFGATDSGEVAFLDIPKPQNGVINPFIETKIKKFDRFISLNDVEIKGYSHDDVEDIIYPIIQNSDTLKIVIGSLIPEKYDEKKILFYYKNTDK